MRRQRFTEISTLELGGNSFEVCPDLVDSRLIASLIGDNFNGAARLVQPEMMRRRDLVKPHGRRTAFLELRVLAQLSQMLPMRHARRHRRMLREHGRTSARDDDRNGDELTNLCAHMSMLRLGVDSRVNTVLRCDMGNTFLIGAVASRSGVTPDTIRYYERLGLLPKPPRTSSGYRQYGDGIIKRLMLIRNAQQFGFSLRDIASFLRIRENGGKPCHDVRRSAEVMLNAVDQQIRALIATRKRMRETLRLWDRKLSTTPTDRPAFLLETLAAGTTAVARPARMMRR